MKNKWLNEKKIVAILSTIWVVVIFILYKTVGYTVLSITLMIGLSIYAGHPIYKRAFSSLKYKIVSIDALVTIAVFGAMLIGEYWEAAAVVYLFMIGDFLESKTIEKTRKTIAALLDKQPSKARRVVDGQYEEVLAESIVKDDEVVVFAGEKIPVDGVVIKGVAAINQSSITGESIPIEAEVNTNVFATTIVESGYAIIKTTATVENTIFAKIIEMVEEAQDKKAKRQKLLERFSRIYTPSIIVLAIFMWIITKDIELALTLLVIACPGALVISTPVSLVAGIGNGAKHGILLKGGESIESLSKIDIVAFDKTGTLTIGKPKVVDMLSFTDLDVKVLAAVGESHSQHPLAKAIIEYANVSHIDKSDTTETFHGKGLRFIYKENEYYLGNQTLMNERGVSLISSLEVVKEYEDRASTLVYLSDNQNILAIFVIEDQIRKESKEVIAQLKKKNIKTVMISGDKKSVAQAIADDLGIDEVYAQALPHQKGEILKQLQKQGSVAMVGDGVNDALALTLADVGIAMGGVGSDVAMESADAVLMSDHLMSMVYALTLAKKTVKNMNINILFAMLVVSVLIIGVLQSSVHLSIGMLVHELSVLLVLIHASMLLKVKPTVKLSV